MPNDPELVRSWALVLDSQGIPYRIQRSSEGWTLIVDAAYAAAAHGALQAFADENQDAFVAEQPSTRVQYGMTYVGLAVALALPVFFLITGGFRHGSKWFDNGSADAVQILNGEPWRVVTALTLHADLGHVLSNTVTLGLFATALMITVGPGVGLWLLLAAGAAGNYSNVLMRQSGYVGIGASTAVFGAVGALAGYEFAHHGRRRGVIALVAGGLLFVLLGTGEHTDILAHFLGLTFGIAMGAITARIASEPLDRRVQWALVALALLAVVACWFLALRTA
jgi:membrane associated rhomboid family serine protease